MRRHHLYNRLVSFSHMQWSMLPAYGQVTAQGMLPERLRGTSCVYLNSRFLCRHNPSVMRRLEASPLKIFRAQCSMTVSMLDMPASDSCSWLARG
jgi:hypothetical protein